MQQQTRSATVLGNAGTTDYAFEVSAANLRFGEGVTVRGWRSFRHIS